MARILFDESDTFSLLCARIQALKIYLFWWREIGVLLGKKEEIISCMIEAFNVRRLKSKALQRSCDAAMSRAWVPPLHAMLEHDVYCVNVHCHKDLLVDDNLMKAAEEAECSLKSVRASSVGSSGQIVDLSAAKTIQDFVLHDEENDKRKNKEP